ncbi:CS1 type fimbrial major subunit [Xanthomonas theicola]|uniref:Fimbrial protein n=1 Tax=Xanthomonas theicola TaxID=56464 RepID=A0A2S6ZM38_9XANT|nr:CS1 type fimbrial major subunit [Xanthomonas theicola]PPT93331.1 hypothetical protein XthCFBP4691_00195 [Xanthomonas theicola]QNH25520.1 hypothetical protein G4Q83_13235 [Xanthomonas theicola]
MPSIENEKGKIMKFNALAVSAVAMMLATAPAFAADQNIEVKLKVASNVSINNQDGTLFKEIELKKVPFGQYIKYAAETPVVFNTNDVNHDIVVTPSEMNISGHNSSENYNLRVIIGGKDLTLNKPTTFSSSEYHGATAFTSMDFAVAILDPSTASYAQNLPAGDYSGTIALSITQST